MPSKKQHRCTKCGGSGNLAQFKHIDNGRCFECGGTGLSDRAPARPKPSEVLPRVWWADPSNKARKTVHFGGTAWWVIQNPRRRADFRLVPKEQFGREEYVLSFTVRDDVVRVAEGTTPVMLTFLGVPEDRYGLHDERSWQRVIRETQTALQGLLKPS